MSYTDLAEDERNSLVGRYLQRVELMFDQRVVVYVVRAHKLHSMRWRVKRLLDIALWMASSVATFNSAVGSTRIVLFVYPSLACLPLLRARCSPDRKIDSLRYRKDYIVEQTQKVKVWLMMRVDVIKSRRIERSMR